MSRELDARTEREIDEITCEGCANEWPFSEDMRPRSFHVKPATKRRPHGMLKVCTAKGAEILALLAENGHESVASERESLAEKVNQALRTLRNDNGRWYLTDPQLNKVWETISPVLRDSGTQAVASPQQDSQDELRALSARLRSEADDLIAILPAHVDTHLPSHYMGDAAGRIYSADALDAVLAKPQKQNAECAVPMRAALRTLYEATEHLYSHTPTKNHPWDACEWCGQRLISSDNCPESPYKKALDIAYAVLAKKRDNRTVECPLCRGDGFEQLVSSTQQQPCHNCNGSGYVAKPQTGHGEERK